MTMKPTQLAFNFYPTPILGVPIYRPSTAASRWIRSRFPMPVHRANLIAALAGYPVEA